MSTKGVRYRRLDCKLALMISPVHEEQKAGLIEVALIMGARVRINHLLALLLRMRKKEGI